jgi:hypothetical protein
LEEIAGRFGDDVAVHLTDADTFGKETVDVRQGEKELDSSHRELV